MSKAAVIGAVVIIGVGVVGGGGYYYASQKATQELHNTIDLIQKSVPGSSLKYESSSVSPFSQSATLNKVVFKDNKGQEYTADTLTISGVSQDKLGKLSLDKFHTNLDNGTIDIAHIDATNVVAASGAILVEDGKIKRIFPSKISFDLLNMQNLNAVGPNKSMSFTVGQYELKNYGADRNSDQVLKQVNFQASPDGDEYFKLNQVQISGLNLAQMIASTEQGQTPKVIPGQPAKGTLDGLEFKGGGQTWAVAQFETENSADQNGNQKSSATFSGFKMDTAHNRDLFAVKQMGYDQLNASGKLVGSYDKAQQQWSFAPFELTIQDMGTLNANIEFKGPANLSNANPQEVMTNYKLVSLKVALQNQGLLQKIFESAAKKQNNAQNTYQASATNKPKPVTAEQVKEDMVKMIKQDAATATIPVQKQGDEAIIQLINDPKQSLVIEVKPAQPVGAIELMGKSQSEILDSLNLSVKAEPTK